MDTNRVHAAMDIPKGLDATMDIPKDLDTNRVPVIPDCRWEGENQDSWDSRDCHWELVNWGECSYFANHLHCREVAQKLNGRLRPGA